MELEFLQWLTARLRADPRVSVGIGDDAAVIQPSGQRPWVLTTDTLTEGVDFRLPYDDLRRIGRKALAVNLSDLAAMAARPVLALLTLVLPRRDAAHLAREVTEGVLQLAEQFQVPLAGGDTNTWDGGLVVGVTLVGEATPRGVLLRGGGQAGDAILVTGRFGGSLLGKQFDFTPRIAEVLQLHERYELHAAIDVSDGLSLDLSRLAAASRCGAEIDLASVPIAPAAHLLHREQASSGSPLDHALGDGEDFELILAVPPAEAERMLAERPLDIPLTRIGRLIEPPGLWQNDPRRGRLPLEPRGFQHGQQPGASP